jgi:hypothetical protein
MIDGLEGLKHGVALLAATKEEKGKAEAEEFGLRGIEVGIRGFHDFLDNEGHHLRVTGTNVNLT